MSQYLIANGPMPTTAAQATVLTGTVVKTMLQLKPFNTGKVVKWGIHLAPGASQATVRCELLDTGAIFATVTASADADVTKYSSVEDAVASVVGLTLGTTATGYTSSSEGSIVATRIFDLAILSPNSSSGDKYVYEFALGREPKFIIGNALRIRVTSDVTVACYAYMIVEF